MEMPQSELLYERVEILPNRETLALANVTVAVAPSVNVHGVAVIGLNNAAVVGVNNAFAINAGTAHTSAQALAQGIMASYQGI